MRFGARAKVKVVKGWNCPKGPTFTTVVVKVDPLITPADLAKAAGIGKKRVDATKAFIRTATGISPTSAPLENSDMVFLSETDKGANDLVDMVDKKAQAPKTAKVAADVKTVKAGDDAAPVSALVSGRLARRDPCPAGGDSCLAELARHPGGAIENLTT